MKQLNNHKQDDSYLSECRRQMAEYGLYPEKIIPDGEIHRFPADDDGAGDSSGAYCHYGRGGWFKNWKTMSDVEYFKGDLSEDDLKALQGYFTSTESNQPDIKAVRAGVRRLWESATEPNSHPYLLDKGITAPPNIRQNGDELLITLHNNERQICGMQRILSDGKKRFLHGTRKKGAFYTIKGNPPYFICEGFATGVTINMATGNGVVVSFDAGNLTPVAEAVKKMSNSTEFIIAGDDDGWREDRNVGLLAATEAGNAISAKVVTPKFKNPDGKNTTDFNDLHKLEGIEAVREQLERSIYQKDNSEGKSNKVEKPKIDNTDVSATVRAYLLEGFDGGVFRVSDLKRELNLDNKQYDSARQCVRRMKDQGLIEKHGHAIGSYRVVDKNKTPIDWFEVDAEPSSLILPGDLHKTCIVRAGDMICFAAFKNHNKTGLALETIRKNIEDFEIHFFITEYKSRMKPRMRDFGIDISHPNLKTYPIEKSDYLPDKIESGKGVLNVIDHMPNLDNFYLVGKYQDEIHRNLDGAICVITHQKLDPKNIHAVGGSFWITTPTIAVSIMPGRDDEHLKLKIVKGKEPATGMGNVYGKELEFKTYNGCEFVFDPNGWV